MVPNTYASSSQALRSDEQTPPAHYGHGPPTRGGRSCAECRRRKIRCNKQVPCRACDERGESALCHRASIVPPRRQPEASLRPTGEVDSLKAELDRVHRRLARVEAKLGLTDNADEPVGVDESLDFQESGLVGAMEDAAFDIGQVRRWQEGHRPAAGANTPRHEGRWFEPMPFGPCLAALPSRQQCENLVEAFLVHLNWFCAWLHGPTLKKLHREFWVLRDRGEARDTMFVSLLFAVLSNAAYLLGDEQAQEAGLELERLRQLAPVWFDCSYASFFRCGGLAEPSLVGVQAMVTLNYAFHLSGNSKIHRAMFSINIGAARAVNLHLLGDRISGSAEEIFQREMGRRAWWALVELEWYFTSYHRYSYIAPHNFDSALPELTDEGLAISSQSGSLHPLSYLIATCRSSRILYDLYGTLKPYQNPPYDAVLVASGQLYRLQSLFASLRPSGSAPESHVYMKRVLGMTLAYRSYLIHRAYFVKSLSDTALSKTHGACVGAAQTILVLADEGLPNGFYRLWNVTIWLVAAGLVLALDLVKAVGDRRVPLDAQARRSRLSRLVDLLCTMADQTGIGARGGKLIQHLCIMEGDISAGRPVSLAGITRKDIMGLVGGQSVTEAGSTAPATLRSETSWSTTDQFGSGADVEHGPGDTGADLDELMFLPESWGGDDMNNLVQLPLNFAGAGGTDQQQVLDFFAHLGS